MAHGMKKPRLKPSKTELAFRSPVWAADKRAPMNGEKLGEIATAARMAFHRITNGEMRDGDGDTLAVVVNVSLVLCEWDLGREHLDNVLAAQEALTHAQQRENAGKSFNFTGPEQQTWREVLELHEAHLETAGHLEVMRALATVADRIRRGDVIRVAGITPR